MQRLESTRLYPIECPLTKVAGVPRRFGVGELMVLVTVLAVLFGLTQTLLGATPPEVQRNSAQIFAAAAVLFVGVAAGQALLFGGKKPREASLWTGAVLFPLEMMALSVYESIAGRGGSDVLDSDVGGLLCTVPTGALLGYAAGALVAAVFLLPDRFRGEPDRPKPPPAIDLEPFTEADAAALIGWVKPRELFARWADSAFSYPLDEEQVERRLARGCGEEPDLLMFKAVDCVSRLAVGYVELGDIDRAARSARVQRALVDPIQSQRGALSLLLLEAILKLAFDRMALHRVVATAMEADLQAIKCYKRVGFTQEGVLRDDVPLRDSYTHRRVFGMLEHEWRGFEDVRPARQGVAP